MILQKYNPIKAGVQKKNWIFVKKIIYESRKSEIWKNVEKGKKIGGKGIWKTLNFVLMLVMRFLTNKQVFKAPIWFRLFGEKGLKNMEKCGKRGNKYFFPFFPPLK